MSDKKIKTDAPTADALSVFKKDKGVQKFMAKYRYDYHVTMLPDLAELVRNAYLEGYNNGLGQYPVNKHKATDDAASSSLSSLPKHQLKDRSELAKIVTSRLSPLGKINAIEEVLTSEIEKAEQTAYQKGLLIGNVEGREDANIQLEKAILIAERNLLSSQISYHLFTTLGENGAINRINEIEATLNQEGDSNG